MFLLRTVVGILFLPPTVTGIRAVVGIPAVASISAKRPCCCWYSPIYLCRPAVGDGSKVAGVQTFASMPDVADSVTDCTKVAGVSSVASVPAFYGVPTVAGGFIVLLA
jgi:hypothetical protein